MSNNSLLSNALQIPLFVDGERPSANKFNALFQHLNLKIAILSTALGDPTGTNNIKYKGIYGTLITAFGPRKIVDLNNISISDSIGPQSFLNPMSYLNLDSETKIVSIALPLNTSEYAFEYKVNNNFEFEFDSPLPMVKCSTLIELKNYVNVSLSSIPYFFDVNKNSIYFKDNISELTITYRTSDFQKFSNLNSGFNVVPDPNVFLINGLTNEFKLQINQLAIPGQYAIILPKIKALPINANNTGIPSETDSTNPLNEYQIQIPKNIWDTYNAQNSNIPSNVIALKCLNTGEVFNKASYQIVNKTQIKVENLALDPDCLNTMDFVLLFAGANNLANSVADLNLKMGRHVHNGQYGEEKINIKDISGIFNKQHSLYKYYPSLNIELNHMPQYLHRNGWSLDCDPINNDNTMQGDLVVEKKIIFTKPTSVTGEKPNRPFASFLNNILSVEGTGVEIFKIENFVINRFESSLAFQVLASAYALIDTLLITLRSNTLNYETKNDKNLNVNYINGVKETVQAREIRTVSNPDTSLGLSDTAQIAKEEFVKYIDLGNESVISKFNSYYRNNSYPSNTANLLVESKNNLPPNIVNDKKRSGKIQAETTKTIYVNCIPTFLEQKIPSAGNSTTPKYLIPQGELTDIDLFAEDSIDLSTSTKSSAGYKLYNLRSETLNSIIEYGNKLRDDISTIPNAYSNILTLGNIKFALIKREKFLSDFASAGYLNSDINADATKLIYRPSETINENLKILDSTEEGSRDHIVNYFYNGNNDRNRYSYDTATGTKTHINEYEARPTLNKYDSFYEADLIYMPIRQNSISKDYNDLTIDDLDTSIEFRYLELKELNTLKVLIMRMKL